MEALAIAAMLLLPGAWIAFGLRDGATSFRSRWAWAIALSPLVVAGEFFLAQRAAGSFVQTAWLTATLNVPAVILIWRRWRERIPSQYESSEWEMWRGALVYLAVAGCLILPWWSSPEFRTYSWHGLQQLDIIYAIATVGGGWEAELAGVPLSSAWAPHVAWALEAAAAQRSPTLLYPINNLLLLGACGLLAYELARAIGASKSSATAATALLALGPNLPGVLGWPLSGSGGEETPSAWLGDPRATPLLLELVSFEPAPLGIALLLGVALTSIYLARRPRRQEMVLLGVGLVGLAALYPDLFPPAAALAAAAAATVGWRARRDEGLRIAAIDVAGWAAAGLLASFFVIDAYGAGRAVPAFTLTPLSTLPGKALSVALGPGPFALAAWLFWRAKPERRQDLAVLSIGAAVSLACFVLLRRGGSQEYELCTAAGLLLVAPAIRGLEARFPGFKQRVGWVTLAAILALGGSMFSYSRNRIPAAGDAAPAVDERAFFLSLDPRNRDGRWMAAVRVKSEPEAVLVINRPSIHTTAFTARRLLVGSEGGQAHAGCNRAAQLNLVELRGYDPALVDRRLELLDRIYRPSVPRASDENQKLLEAAAAEAGPDLLFVFLPGDDRSFLDWLRSERHVRVIYDDGEHTVVEP